MASLPGLYHHCNPNLCGTTIQKAPNQISEKAGKHNKAFELEDEVVLDESVMAFLIVLIINPHSHDVCGS